MIMSPVINKMIGGMRIGGILLAALCGCERGTAPGFLGSAVVESRTWTVSSTVQGTLTDVAVGEGDRIAAGAVVAVVDTVPLQFLRREAAAGIAEIAATVRARKAEIAARAIDVAGLEREFKRIDGLAAKGAATTQQRDNLSTQLQAAQAKLAAANSALEPLAEKEKSLRIKLESISDQIRRCTITAPGTGVVLTQFRNRGEVVGPGTPVCELGALDTLQADFFVPQPVLATLRRGQKVAMRIDWDSAGIAGEKRLPATVSWIGEEAEFTPKNIQTRHSRNELVFRVRCTAENSNGILKRGLPVEIWR
jgi:HlyD family secretion protein